MSTRRNRFWRLVPRLAAYVAAGIGVLVLAGWIFNVPELTSLLPNVPSMKANTAFSFLLVAGCLYLAAGGGHPRLCAVLALGAVSISALTIFEYVTGYSLGIDQLVFDDPAAPYPGRMSPFTALSFILLGTALIPFTRWKEAVREGLALSVMVISMFAIVGYLYGIPALYGAVNVDFTPMALDTSAAFFALAIGFLAVPRGDGIVRIFRGGSIAAMVARFLVPVGIVVPIVLGGVFMYSRFTMGHLPLAMALSAVSNVLLLVGLTWYFCFMIQRTEQERAALKQQAETDRLTAIYNRRYFDMTLEREVERARRYGNPLSLIMFDLDYFKNLNDTYGHLTGDRVLCRVARQCERHLRSTDVFCRYGGEEFAVIAAETSPVAAMMLARRIREDIARANNYQEAVTISAGVAGWDKVRFETKEDLIAAADKALYQAKSSGRNRECLYVEADRPTPASSLE
ncbi:MAG: GGDEF domain-containing protein [Actinomycetota bacterium]